jgi:hypothetical protein
MTKKSKAPEAKPGDKSRASKHKQQSAPVASGISVPEKAKKPKGETAFSSVLSPPAEVAKGTSASNVAEEEQKMSALPKCVAVPREVIGAGAVPAEVKAVAPLVKAVEAQGVAGEKLEEAEENKDDDDDDDDSGGSYDDEDVESGDKESEYAPPEDGSV